MVHLNTALIETMRRQARSGCSVSQIFNDLKVSLNRDDVHILDILAYFRAAFFLSLSEAKPIVGLSRKDGRQITDEALLDTLMMPEIEKHRSEWDVCRQANDIEPVNVSIV